jgi:hypothetical protein
MKTQSPQEKSQIMRQKRDAKVADHLSQYAPVWMKQEDMILHEDAIQFEVVFYHPLYQWVQRRYRYDSFNNVLYHKGQILVDEAETYALTAQDPFIAAPVLNTVNSYGG